MFSNFRLAVYKEIKWRKGSWCHFSYLCCIFNHMCNRYYSTAEHIFPHGHGPIQEHDGKTPTWFSLIHLLAQMPFFGWLKSLLWTIRWGLARKPVLFQERDMYRHDKPHPTMLNLWNMMKKGEQMTGYGLILSRLICERIRNMACISHMAI